MKPDVRERGRWSVLPGRHLRRARGGGVSEIKVMVANEPRSYRETIAYALAELRPDIEVLVVEPEDLEEELLRVSPHLVVCSRVTKLVEREAPAWIELYPDFGPESVVAIDGQMSIYPDMDLEAVLSIVDETERLFGDS
jgi:hypothetical protein